MSYSFSNLAHADFEDLVRDLIGRELKIRFEAFGPGPDGGIDGRHARGRASTILQAKHYVGSQFNDLLAAMKRERQAIDRLDPARYVLATSRPLSPQNKDSLVTAIGPALKRHDDILAAGDLNALLRKYPDIEKAHIKLWLSSTAVLERITRAAAYAFAAITLDEIKAKVRVYAPNPSFAAARNILESQHLLIISGPPGVGKTTLAEMLAYAYVGEAWKLVPIRSLEDGFAAIVDTENQIFLFDDFLGRVALDKNSLAAKDSDLSRFMKRTRKSPNARFVLTTRAYIFEEARRVSEYLADNHLNISKYVLDVGVYTRRIKARILYNHLIVSKTPVAHIRALVDSGELPGIIDHDNYNPRVIEWMTDTLQVSAIPPKAYADAFLHALDHPNRLWDTAFRTHLPEKCRHLLYSLFFGSEYGERISNLRVVYQSLHPRLCAKYGQTHDPKDFEESLRILEGSFIAIRGSAVEFVNPSFRDYLTDYLDDLDQLKDFAAGAARAGWAQAVWRHGKKLAGKARVAAFAASFISIAEEFAVIPTWAKSGNYPYSYSPSDLANSDRIELLLDWWEASGNSVFARLATNLAANPVNGFDSWRDATDLLELFRKFRDDEFSEFPFEEEMLIALEGGIVAMLNSGVDSDDLERISDKVAWNEETFGHEIAFATKEAIQREFQHIARTVQEIDSESTLSEHKLALQSLAPRAGITDAAVASALRVIDNRISAIAEEAEEAETPSFTGSTKRDIEKFDDAALMNLFAPLLYS